MSSVSILACVLSSAYIGVSLAAGTTAVTNYSWLQLPDIGVTVGSTTAGEATDGVGYTGHSALGGMVIGDNNPWIPNAALTDGGTNDFWITFDYGSPRQLDRVRASVWAAEGTALHRIRFLGSNDGATFTPIAVYEFAGPAGGVIEQQLDGNSYRYLRLRMNGEGSQPGGPDYEAAAGNVNRGGPGFSNVEPYGAGDVGFEEINVANANVFGAVPSFSSDIEFPWTGFNNGVLEDGARVGEQMPWDEGRYIQLDLGATRKVFRSKFIGDDYHTPASVSLSYSDDGVNFTAFDGLGEPKWLGSGTGGGIEYTFPPVSARYWRITEMAQSGSGYALLNQWMLYQTDTHAPVLAATNFTAYVDESGVARLKPEDADAGTDDVDGDTLTATFSPAFFRYADIGTTQQVEYTVSDGRYTVSTNLSVAVELDPNLGNLVPVFDYSWLQLPTGVTAGVGSTATTKPFNTEGYTSHAEIDCFRWGSRCWIPDAAISGFGTEDYWAAIKLEPAREVHAVNIEFWCEGSRALRRFTVEGSVDGETFEAIGSHDFGALAQGDSTVVSVDVTPGVYSVVRVRMNGTNSQPDDPDYTAAGPYGGPGLWTLEPVGNGAIPPYFVNYANVGNFDTVASQVTDRGGAVVNSGSLVDRSLMVGEDYPWDDGHYVQIDLGVARPVYRSIIAMTREYGMTAATFAWSNDGENFTVLENVAPPVLHNEVFSSYGAIEYTFPAVTARYWRIVGASGGSYALFNQWMLYASDNRAPVVRARDISFTVGAAGVDLSPADVDDGTYDPDGDEITLSVTPSQFGFKDVGQTIPVLFSAADALVVSATNIMVTVRADPALNGMIPVKDYNWLQLPGDEVSVAGCLISDDLATMTPAWSGYGSPSDMRWGNKVWIPHGGAIQYGTGFGESNYVGVVTFATPRNVTSVKVAMWTGEGTMLGRYYVDVSPDGESWTSIACYEKADPVEGEAPVNVFAVPSATYKAVRVRVMAGDYTADREARGGPGIYMIQPCGAGAVPPDQVNWANRGNFDAVLSSHGMDSAGSGNIEGDFSYGDGGRIGTVGRGFAPYGDGTGDYDYIQIDLGARRWLRSAIILWNYIADGPKTILGSDDGENFFVIPLDSVIESYGSRMTEHSFAQKVKTRYIRLADCDNTLTGHALLNQILIMGAKPDQGTILLLK